MRLNVISRVGVSYLYNITFTYSSIDLIDTVVHQFIPPLLLVRGSSELWILSALNTTKLLRPVLWPLYSPPTKKGYILFFFFFLLPSSFSSLFKGFLWRWKEKKRASVRFIIQDGVHPRFLSIGGRLGPVICSCGVRPLSCQSFPFRREVHQHLQATPTEPNAHVSRFMRSRRLLPIREWENIKLLKMKMKNNAHSVDSIFNKSIKHVNIRHSIVLLHLGSVIPYNSSYDVKYT